MTSKVKIKGWAIVTASAGRLTILFGGEYTHWFSRAMRRDHGAVSLNYSAFPHALSVPDRPQMRIVLDALLRRTLRVTLDEAMARSNEVKEASTKPGLWFPSPKHGKPDAEEVLHPALPVRALVWGESYTPPKDTEGAPEDAPATSHRRAFRWAVYDAHGEESAGRRWSMVDAKHAARLNFWRLTRSLLVEATRLEKNNKTARTSPTG